MEKLQELDITKEELERFGEALKKKEFRDLLVEYCEEINDPANRKQYEEEITQLERERGVEVTFIHPTPCYVIKTSINGNKLAFINICSNDEVGKPSFENSFQDGSQGLQWSLPHLLSPPREDLNKKGSRCTVYDVLFNPQTLHLASQKPDFRDMVNKISCEAIEKNFSVTIDKSNLKFPKMKYKGAARPLVIRKKTGRQVNHENSNDEIDKFYTDMYNKIDTHYNDTAAEIKSKENKNYSSQQVSEYATPKYLIKHRNDIDLQEYTHDRDSKINVTVPKEIIIEINLPLLKCAADLTLDVTEKEIKLISEKPSKYKLNLTLPYSINEDLGNAKFDVDKRILVVTLPVKRNFNLLSDIGRYDSGVEIDSDNSPSDKNNPLIEELSSEENKNGVQKSEVFRTSEKFFLNPDLHYSLPEYTCHLFDNTLSFTLNVKNVDSDSLKKEFNNNSVHLKFSSISSGYFPVNYALFVQLPSHFIEVDDVTLEAWDNNVILQIPYKPYDKSITTYFVGIDQDDIQEKFLDEPSIINDKFLVNMNKNPDKQNPNVQVELDSDDELTITINPDKIEKNTSSSSSTTDTTNSELSPKSRSLSESSIEEEKVKNIKSRSFSESSVDESVSGASPSKKSILKSRSLSRSISESSVDDYTWSSFENCTANSESLIPEEAETLSSSMKKTVRFSDVVSKQLFRMNSSILGQRKKNQKKNMRKKRAQERKLSESENSEAEEKKEKSTLQSEKNDANSFKKEQPDVQTKDDKQQFDFKSDLIFDLDM